MQDRKLSNISKSQSRNLSPFMYQDRKQYCRLILNPSICFLVKQSIKGRSRQLRPKAHILDDPLGNPYDILKVPLGPPYGPQGPTKVPYGPMLLQKKEPYSSRKKEPSL